MKRTIYLVVGAVVGIILGTLLSVPFNHWYTENFVHSDDDANFLVSMLLFVFWPAFGLFGAFIGNGLYKKR